jgi:hypothetical protein
MMSLIEVAKAGGVRSLHLVKHPSQDAASAPASKPCPIRTRLVQLAVTRGFKFGLFNASSSTKSLRRSQLLSALDSTKTLRHTACARRSLAGMIGSGRLGGSPCPA